MAVWRGVGVVLCVCLARLEAAAFATSSKAGAKDYAGAYDDSALEEDQEYGTPPMPPPAYPTARDQEYGTPPLPPPVYPTARDQEYGTPPKPPPAYLPARDQEYGTPPMPPPVFPTARGQEYGTPPMPPPAYAAARGEQEEQEGPGAAFVQDAANSYGPPDEAPSDAQEMQEEPAAEQEQQAMEPGPADPRSTDPRFTGALMQRAAEAAAIRNMQHRHEVMKQFMNRFSKNLRFAVLEDSQGDLPEGERLAMMKKLRQEGATGETSDAARADAAVAAATREHGKRRFRQTMPSPSRRAVAQRRPQQLQQRRMQVAEAQGVHQLRPTAAEFKASPRGAAPQKQSQPRRHKAMMLNAHRREVLTAVAPPRGPASRSAVAVRGHTKPADTFDQDYTSDSVTQSVSDMPGRMAPAAQHEGESAALAYGDDSEEEAAPPANAEDAPPPPRLAAAEEETGADYDPEMQQPPEQTPAELEDSGAEALADPQAMVDPGAARTQLPQPTGGAAEGDDPVVVDALGRSIPLVLGGVQSSTKIGGKEIPGSSQTWISILIVMAVVALLGIGGGYFYMNR